MKHVGDSDTCRNWRTWNGPQSLGVGNQRTSQDHPSNNITEISQNLKKIWNMKVTIISIVIGAFGTVTKGLLRGLEDLEVGRRVKTIQATILLRSARILRRFLET